MKSKLLLSAALAGALVLSAPAHAGLNGGDWADIVVGVIGMAAGAAQSYNAAVQAQAAAAQPQVVYTGWTPNPDGSVTCTYSNGTALISPTLGQCPAYF